MTAIQMKAVRKRRRRIVVRGRATAWMPPRRSSNRSAHTNDPGKPRSASSWY
jgi:hypothetical protein